MVTNQLDDEREGKATAIILGSCEIWLNKDLLAWSGWYTPVVSFQTQEAEAGGLPQGCAWLTQWILGQRVLHNESLSQRAQTSKHMNKSEEGFLAISPVCLKKMESRQLLVLQASEQYP